MESVALEASKVRHAVVVPTCNRRQLLLDLLDNLQESQCKPQIVVIVDSSDSSQAISKTAYSFQIELIQLKTKSAAIQRNVGMNYLENTWNSFDFISFLDDDVRVNSDYFVRVSRNFIENSSAIGVSGVTNERFDSSERTWFTDFIGLTGDSCTITKALVNIPNTDKKKHLESHWLIGCSSWKSSILQSAIRFESDFFEHSLFEDVIFSFRCRALGNLVCDPDIEIHHLMANEGRISVQARYKYWVVNRKRLLTYGTEFRPYDFWALNFIQLLSSILYLAKNSYQAKQKLVGLKEGIVQSLFGIKRR